MAAIRRRYHPARKSPPPSHSKVLRKQKYKGDFPDFSLPAAGNSRLDRWAFDHTITAKHTTIPFPGFHQDLTIFATLFTPFLSSENSRAHQI